GGRLELVEDDRTGRLVPYDDDDALVRIVGYLLDVPEERARLSGTARRMAEERYGAATDQARLPRLGRQSLAQGMDEDAGTAQGPARRHRTTTRSSRIWPSFAGITASSLSWYPARGAAWSVEHCGGNSEGSGCRSGTSSRVRASSSGENTAPFLNCSPTAFSHPGSGASTRCSRRSATPTTAS